MTMHKNARLTPKGRALSIVRLDGGERPCDAARAMGVTVRTVYKWRRRYRQQCLPGARHPPHLHQALHAQDQWQGAALHPVIPARMGLREGLSKFRRLKAELQLWLHHYDWH